MKAKIFLLLILGSLFLHPWDTFASTAKALTVKESSLFNLSFQKALLKNFSAVKDSRSSNAFDYANIVDYDLAADIDVEDDDDVSFSTRKKISFERLTHFNTYQSGNKHFEHLSFSKYSFPHFYHISASHFIFLRVFRL